MTMNDIVTSIVGILALIFTAITVVRGLIEYKKQGVAKRAEMFLQMRARLRDNPTYANICALLETDSERLRDVPLIDKDRFIGFFEELAIMKNSGLINESVALYMFGYFAVRCYESGNFWHGLNRNQPLWSLFLDFAKQMRNAEERFHFERKDFHF